MSDQRRQAVGASQRPVLPAQGALRHRSSIGDGQPFRQHQTVLILINQRQTVFAFFRFHKVCFSAVDHAARVRIFRGGRG